MSETLKEPSQERSNAKVNAAVPDWRRYLNRLLAAEVANVTRYCDQILQLAPRTADSGLLLEALEGGSKRVIERASELSMLARIPDARAAILLNGNLNHDFDIEGVLRTIWQYCNRGSRVVAVAYNPYLRWAYSLANWFGIRSGEQPSTFVTRTDLENLAALAGFEVVRNRPVGFSLWALAGVGDLANRVLASIPFVRWFSFASVVVLRPIKPDSQPPTLSIVIPARNERGNIENALKRLGTFGGKPPEVIFVEGHSNDGTWEEIQRVLPLYADRFPLQAHRQTGKGKADAVRLGFGKATCDLVTILDADLTMPPELLGRFYDAYTRGLADFVNGSRLVYPMEGSAMKFLNRLGNIFFAKALSAVLETNLGDSLCGTKLLARRDYERMVAWRKDFGDFDPFGDFELLFPAATLGLGVVDVPVRYRDRTYGSTNIRRFYHGWMLLKMTLTGLLRVRVGASGMER